MSSNKYQFSYVMTNLTKDDKAYQSLSTRNCTQTGMKYPLTTIIGSKS